MQRSLFDDGDSIQERFERFHAEHPDVYALFVQFACELLDRGREHYSSDAILHRIRWHYATSGNDESGFKINDHYSSRYARLLMGEDARFREFFETRQLKTA